MKPIAIFLITLIFAGRIFANDASLVGPSFGPNGKEFHAKSPDDAYNAQGWLPLGWTDNSGWAAVGVNYTRLDDPPEPGLTALRMTVTERTGGVAQLCSVFQVHEGNTYLVEGWVRSESGDGIIVQIRKPNPPYTVYAKKKLAGANEWQHFELSCTVPEIIDDEKSALLMFCQEAAGSVDIAGVTVHLN